MRRCYSDCVPNRQPPLPDIWLVSDARNDAALERILARLPRGSGLIFRHYHLDDKARRARFARLARTARRHGHCVVLSGSAREARRWNAGGAYGAPDRLARGPAMLRLATVHSLHELAKAHHARADAVLISPVFATRSHPGAGTLGPVRFRLLAIRSRVPVIALGGMTAQRARCMGASKWAAIQGLAERPTAMFPLHS
ncbi:thiamine phosphate synthase [Novosphingobium mangrovi (ex Huang et al. 2023)]|uniref:Thiamine phosphate synthase n=1 Tax=Novosphingobium mangrovi (ex Huang et al. 2023) TaxID=2976432 RepID=A0ABT2I3N6_9SPHN|nr:thiamine phosphate synthase [Novosphingobium mangrovi (ex Huang et al. 2023)]MCT2399253.1 thiamine phosphate synthase [Novosphingobium mangrovi (ex Huang et al. 2023)]